AKTGGVVSVVLRHGVTLFLVFISILQRVDESRYPLRIMARPELLATAELRSAWTGHSPVTTRTLAVHKSCEHFVRIDRDKQALTARQHFPFSSNVLGPPQPLRPTAR